MYEENNSNFALKDIILKILFGILFVFIVIWLFPTKSYVNNLVDQKLGTSGNQVFSNNIKSMKEAALTYYTGDRLPENTDDKVKMTLESMLNKNLLVEFKDSNGKTCDAKNSYVEVTKNVSDYSMKVNLECSDKKTYVMSYFGSYDYCTLEVCEKKKLAEIAENEAIDKETTENEAIETEYIPENNKVVNNVQNTPKTPTTNPAISECQYIKRTNDYWTGYGAWSNWTTNKVNSSNSRQVETKTEKVQTGTKKVATGSKIETSPPKTVTTTQNGVQKKVYTCSTYYDNPGTYSTPKTCYKTITVYKNEPVYGNVIYYRYRDRSYVKGITDYKWSNCNNKTLLNSGYTKTGNTR